MNQTECIELLESIEGRLFENEPLSFHTGFKTGGNAAAFFFPRNVEAFIQTVSLLEKNSIKYYVLGNGSDVLALDFGYSGIVVCTRDMKEIKVLPDREIYCVAGVQLRELCMTAMNFGYSGAEFAFGIPGTVGGAVFMNAGAYGGEIKDILIEVDVFDGVNVKTFTADEAKLSYRHSVFQDDFHLKIIGARFRFKESTSESVRAIMDENLTKRKSKQPLEYPSCGSAFKRPATGFAAALIEQSGLKGFSIGGAAVSDKHAGFVINKNGASSSDIINLLASVKNKVFSDSGVQLEPEIRIME